MRKQVLKLQRKMRELGIDVYVVSDIDEHLSEYVSDHFHALEEYSGFTGGDGKLVVTAGSSDADTGKDFDWQRFGQTDVILRRRKTSWREAESS